MGYQIETVWKGAWFLGCTTLHKLITYWWAVAKDSSTFLLAWHLYEISDLIYFLNARTHGAWHEIYTTPFKQQNPFRRRFLRLVNPDNRITNLGGGRLLNISPSQQTPKMHLGGFCHQLENENNDSLKTWYYQELNIRFLVFFIISFWRQ